MANAKHNQDDTRPDIPAVTLDLTPPVKSLEEEQTQELAEEPIKAAQADLPRSPPEEIESPASNAKEQLSFPFPKEVSGRCSAETRADRPDASLRTPSRSLRAHNKLRKKNKKATRRTTGKQPLKASDFEAKKSARFEFQQYLVQKPPMAKPLRVRRMPDFSRRSIWIASVALVLAVVLLAVIAMVRG